MGYLPTTTLGQKLPDPATVQAFETLQVNANQMILEDAILAGQGRLDDLEGVVTAYTPTITGMTLGDGNVIAYYVKLGKLVYLRATITFGTTSVMGDLIFGLPVTADNALIAGSMRMPGTVQLLGSGGSAQRILGDPYWSDSNTLRIMTSEISGSYLRQKGLGPTVPFTWASGNSIVLAAVYVAA